MTLNPGDFGASFKGFLDQMASEATPKEEPIFLKRIREHFEADPSMLPIITENFDEHEHPDFYLSLDHYVSEKDRSAEILGVTVGDFQANDLSDFVNKTSGRLMGGVGAATEGPVQYLNIEGGDGRVITCVKSGLYLITDGDERLVAYLRAGNDRLFQKGKLEVMAKNHQTAERFHSNLRKIRRKESIYRGHIISLGIKDHRNLQVLLFHHLPMISRNDIVLPDGLLERIERQSLGFSTHSDKLLRAGRHLKRGILLHGKPGTGKTLTAMYLAREMANRTVILLTGRSLALIEQSCALARLLQPSMVVLEDVDLVAEERTRSEGCPSPLLFELLNQMDGLQDDADILFVLTTNRPDILEPALAARPGRIDQAFEVPLPNRESRERLFKLYGKGLKQNIENTHRLIDKTEGASPAFIRELFRKAALFAAEGNDEIVVEDRHMDEALHELTVDGGELTKIILGFQHTDAPKT